jgi:hypothetical protein
MKKVIKIGLIVFASLAVAFGIIYYVDTVISEPPKGEIGNSHLEQLVADGDRLRLSDNYKVSLDLYEKIMRKSDMHSVFGYISPTDKRNIQEPAVGEFAKTFSNSSFEDFHKSSWDEGALNHKKQMVRTLRGTGYITGDSDVNKHLGTISSTVDRYYEAKELAGTTTFVSYENAKERIARAKSLAADAWLKNNTNLVASLNALPEAIHTSHFNYLTQTIKPVGQIDISKFGKASLVNLQSSLSHYKGGAQETYGTIRDVSALEKRLREIDTAVQEWEQWMYAKDGDTVYDYKSYLQKYPNSKYADRARARLAQLQ